MCFCKTDPFIRVGNLYGSPIAFYHEPDSQLTSSMRRKYFQDVSRIHLVLTYVNHSESLKFPLWNVGISTRPRDITMRILVWSGARRKHTRHKEQESRPHIFEPDLSIFCATPIKRTSADIAKPFVNQRNIMHSILYDMNTTGSNHSPCCAERTISANRLNASSTSFSGSKLNEARTYGVGLPDMKNEVPGSARTPASTAFWRMRASEFPSGAPSEGGRSNLNLNKRNLIRYTCEIQGKSNIPIEHTSFGWYPFC